MSDSPTRETIEAEAPEGATHFHTGLKAYLKAPNKSLAPPWRWTMFVPLKGWVTSSHTLENVQAAVVAGEMMVLCEEQTPQKAGHHPAAPVAADFMKALEDDRHPYHSMAHAFLSAYEQAAIGKGKERHANDLPFEKQRMQSIADGQGHVGGMIYQICKKAEESEFMEPEKRKHELRGAIVYAAGAIIWTDRHSSDDAAEG